jgi:hypothetical protein
VHFFFGSPEEIRDIGAEKGTSENAEDQGYDAEPIAADGRDDTPAKKIDDKSAGDDQDEPVEGAGLLASTQFFEKERSVAADYHVIAEKSYQEEEGDMVGYGEDDGADEDRGHTKEEEFAAETVVFASFMGEHGDQAGGEGGEAADDVEDEDDFQKAVHNAGFCDSLAKLP